MGGLGYAFLSNLRCQAIVKEVSFEPRNIFLRQPTVLLLLSDSIVRLWQLPDVIIKVMIAHCAPGSLCGLSCLSVTAQTGFPGG